MPQRSIAACHRFAAGREVQVHRHLARPATSRCWPARRRPMPAAAGRSVGSRRRVAADPARQQQRADERAPERQRRRAGVGHAERPPVVLRGPDELRGRATRRGPRRIAAASAPRVISARRTSAAGVVDGSGAPNATVTGYGNAHRPLPEEAAALEAEDAAPDAIEVDRNDRHVEAVDDPLEPALERQHVAGPADRAFGEDADDVAVLQLRARRSIDGERLAAGCRSESRSSASAADAPPSGRSTAGRPGSG